MKTLYIDCFCGAAGDMLLGALIEAGADYEAISKALNSLGVDGYTLSCEKVNKHGTMATKFDVHVDDAHDHPHRHLRHIVEIIEAGDLPKEVKEASLETFRRIAECEAEVHGTTIERVHFHEVGAVDSIVDIVGVHLALHQLQPERIVSSALHVGSGTVKCAHGVMPVPAPATVLLLRGVPSYSGDVDGELVTPTGAALVAQVADEFGPMPHMRINTVGVGSGTKDLPDRPNVLRVMWGDAVGDFHTKESITVIEANIDDMNPELLPPLLEDLLESGARDAFITPILGKKGRPAHLITVLADDKKVSAVTDTLLRGSSTLGVRMRKEQRICLERDWKHVLTPWGDVRVKIGTYKGTTSTTSPEYEDCARVAREGGVTTREVYESAYAAAIKGEYKDA
ncbi:MAG: TIGR00299 family protein [Candidatus Hydrogenedentota bacterium]|nr:MAG: TIGR00299 family protein [Candidatus Hydrogenedentota bacterium]